MAIFPHGNKIRLDCQIKGQRFVRSFATREEAQAWQAKAKARVALGLPADDTVEALKDMTVGEALQRATQAWMQQKDGRGSITNGTDIANALGRDRRLTTLDKGDVNSLVSHFQAQGLANGTINRKLSALSSLLSVGRDTGLAITLKVPFLKEAEGRTRFLSFLEEQSVLADFRTNGIAVMVDAVATAIDTGLRLSELLAIRASWVRQEASGGWSLTVGGAMTKSSKTRTIPLTSRVVAILQERLKTSSRAWPEDLTADKVGTLWAAMRERLGLQDDEEFVFHATRHTCAVRLLEATGNLVLVRDWLGHADIRTTTIYAKVVSGTLQAGVQALEQASRRVA